MQQCQQLCIVSHRRKLHTQHVVVLTSGTCCAPPLQGRITEADLQEYAEAQNLPRTYVRPFMEAILQQQQQQPGPGAAAGSMALPSEEFEEGEVKWHVV